MSNSRDYPACVTGWEFPGQPQGADACRRFEAVWSVDPQAVRDAAVICARLARSAHPGLGPLLDTLPSGPPAPASADLRRAGLLTRMTSYLEKAEPLTPPAAHRLTGSPAHRLPEQAGARGGRSS
jgi:DICT domain-containing protein